MIWSSTQHLGIDGASENSMFQCVIVSGSNEMDCFQLNNQIYSSSFSVFNIQIKERDEQQIITGYLLTIVQTMITGRAAEIAMTVFWG